MNLTTPQVAIVILNWNGRKFLEQFLPSVLQTQYPNFRVVVADNASTDDSVAFLQRQYPQVEQVHNNSNGGYARGYNEALRQIDADYFVLLNSDVEVTPGWLTPAITLLESDAAIAACQPKILSWHNRQLFEYAGAAGGYLDRYAYPFARGRMLDNCEPDTGQYDDALPVFWASGAALIIKAACFRGVGGLDDGFFAHQEEIDLCWRLQRKGHRVYACPQSVVYHVGGGTLPQGSPRKVYLNFRNGLMMMRKNLHPAERYGKIIIRLCLDVVAAYRFLLQGHFSSFSAVAKAHLHFFAWCWRRRPASEMPYRKLRELDGVSKKILVWQYFIKKKRRFNEMR